MANSQLNFNITQNSNCDSVTFENCSEYCEGTTYDSEYCIAYFTGYQRFASTSRRFYLYGGVASTAANISTYSWTLGAQTGASQNFSCTLTTNSVNTITFTVTDDNGLSSTCTIKIKLDSSNNIEWILAPNVSITPDTNPLTVYFADNSFLETTSLDTTGDSLTYGDASSTTTIPVNKTYASTGTYSLTYTVTEDEDSTTSTNAFQYKISSTSNTCTAELTEENITEVILKMTDPNGLIENVDITTQFLNSPFDILQDDLETVDFTESGIWTFQVTVTKVDGSTYIFQQAKQIVIFCDIKCKYAKLLLKKTGLASDCQDCDEITLNQIFNIDIYLSGLKDLIACRNTEGINNAITVLNSLVENTDCSCD